MIADLINRQCVIVRREPVDDEFTPGAPPDTYEVAVCYLEQRRPDEPELQGERSETTWLIVLPAGIEPLSTGDAVAVEGTLYELVGDSWPVYNPRTQQVSHLEATAKAAGEVMVARYDVAAYDAGVYA